MTVYEICLTNRTRYEGKFRIQNVNDNLLLCEAITVASRYIHGENFESLSPGDQFIISVYQIIEMIKY